MTLDKIFSSILTWVRSGHRGDLVEHSCSRGRGRLDRRWGGGRELLICPLQVPTRDPRVVDVIGVVVGAAGAVVGGGGVVHGGRSAQRGAQGALGRKAVLALLLLSKQDHCVLDK